MKAALVELSVPDEEHPDTWLTDEKDCTVIVDEKGVVTLSQPGRPRIQRVGVNHEQALRLWLLLQQGKADEVHAWLAA
ncbi:hypothetical protein [Inhella proteolytica]|uniref:Uncharacterized protein n=1 Tax=Inhella proteolytica TaxID=2795029 RepID=A0A931J147_9BURK|nr:hypothetical protein [Inhella proteolytica]MBH9576431.1 hypothetical protein [Inhella proteolytica]